MPTARLLVAALLVTSAVLLLACGTSDPGEVDDDADATTDPPDEESDKGGDEVEGDDDAGDGDGDQGAAGGGTGASDSRELTLAIADAAERTGLDEDDIELDELSMVTWSDGAIGCPQPDVMYTQALVEGYRIVLDAGGTRLHYHGASGEDPFLCEDPQQPVAEAG